MSSESKAVPIQKRHKPNAQVQLKQPRSRSQLCSICSSIDFDSITWHDKPKKGLTWPPPHLETPKCGSYMPRMKQAFREAALGVSLGSVANVFHCRHYCDLCGLIAWRIELLTLPRTGQCRVSSKFFCRTLSRSLKLPGQSEEHTSYRAMVLIQQEKPPSILEPSSANLGLHCVVLQ